MELPTNLRTVVYFIRLSNLSDPFERAAYYDWRNVVTEEYIEMWGCQLWFGRFQYVDPVLGDQNPSFGQDIYRLFCERFSFEFPENPGYENEGYKIWFDYYNVKFGWNRPLDHLLTNYAFILSGDFGRIQSSVRRSYKLGWITLFVEFDRLLHEAAQENYVNIHIGSNYTYFGIFPHTVPEPDDESTEEEDDSDSEYDSEDELGLMFNEFFEWGRSVGIVEENHEE